MSVSPDLDIPSLHNLGAASQQPHRACGQAQHYDQGEDTGRDIDRANHTANNPGNQLIEFVRDQLCLEAIQSLASLVSERQGNTDDYLKRAASELTALRESPPRVTKVDGRPISATLTPPEIPALRGTRTNLGDRAYLTEESETPNDAFSGPNRLRLEDQQSGRFQQEIEQFARGKGTPNSKTGGITGGQTQSWDLPQDLSRLLSSHVEILGTLEGANTQSRQGVPGMHLLMDQAALPAETKKALTRISQRITNAEGSSSINALEAGASTQVSQTGMAPCLREAKTTTQSIEIASLKVTDGFRAHDYLDGMLKEFASTIHGVRRFRDFVEGSGNAGGSDCASDLVPEPTAERPRPAIVNPQNSRAGERTGLIGSESLLGRTEWVEINSALEQLRREGKSKTERQVHYQMPQLSYAQLNKSGCLTETNSAAPVAIERGGGRQWQMSGTMHSRFFNLGGSLSMLDHEIRRILEQRIRIMKRPANPVSTRLLASPLPNPITRM
jgi:hypothetical protein